MKVLIIGATGFIGNAALDFFSEKYSVTGVDVIGNPKKNIIQASRFEITQQLILNNKFDVIINCAGSSNVSQSFVDPISDFQLNTLLVQNILSSLKETSPKTKFINLSSAAVYGNPKSFPIKETDQTNPLSPYGLHKLLSEQLIDNYCKFYGIKGLSIRIFSAYGKGLKRQFFYDLFSKFKSNDEGIDLIGTGNESRDFIYITDIVHAFEILTHNAAFNGEVYNLAGEEESFIRQTAHLFSKICGYNGEIKFTQKQFEGYPLNWKADVSKLNSLGFSRKIELEEGLKLYFDWVKNI